MRGAGRSTSRHCILVLRRCLVPVSRPSVIIGGCVQLAKGYSTLAVHMQRAKGNLAYSKATMPKGRVESQKRVGMDMVRQTGRADSSGA